MFEIWTILVAFNILNSLFLESPYEASKAQDNCLNLVFGESYLHRSNKVTTLHTKHSR